MGQEEAWDERPHGIVSQLSLVLGYAGVSPTHEKPSKLAATQWGCLENQEEGCICDTEAMDSRLAWYTDRRLDYLSSLGSMKQEGQSRLDKK